ncbi:MAG: hypothetical protein HRT94_07970 [Alphaproteobacteria bacterium]|nr:hypothetical protein [Alphaproteobacteria bacterium]
MPSGDDNDFGKQRRNLMLLSGLIFLNDFLEIDYSEANIFGIKADNLEHLSVILFILWAYFFIRFFNKFYEEPSTLWGPIRRIYTEYLEASVNQYANKNADPEHPPDFRKVQANYEYNNIFYPHFHMFDYADNCIKEYMDIKDFNLKRRNLNWFYFKASLKYGFKTHYFTEYYFPILFGLLPLWPLSKTVLGYIS